MLGHGWATTSLLREKSIEDTNYAGEQILYIYQIILMKAAPDNKVTTQRTRNRAQGRGDSLVGTQYLLASIIR
jgi:hypothetical protein